MECFYASDIGVHPKARNDIAAKKKEGKGCIDKAAAAAAGSEEATLAAASSKQ